MGSLKSKLLSGEKAVGVMIGDYSPTMVEIYGHSGFDFVFIDDEHGAFSYSEVEHMLRAATLCKSLLLSEFPMMTPAYRKYWTVVLMESMFRWLIRKKKRKTRTAG